MRLIDADNLRDIFKYETCLFEPNDVLDYIDSECAIHAIEVVRCKDCIMKESPKEFGDLYCRILGTDMKNDDFCSYGDRKGEVESDGMDQRER